MDKRPTEEVQKATLAWAKERAQGWLKVLNGYLSGANTYLAGDKITIADYYGSCFVALAEAIGSDLSAYPNVKRWLEKMKGLKSWNQVHEVIKGYAATLKGPFETV